jgi:RHS repeat-associated protein
VSAFDYLNDTLARRTARIDSGSATATNQFGYNPRSELTNAAMGTNAYGYAYDPIGNRQTYTANGTTNRYAANALNQYTNITAGSVVVPLYDLDGNLTNYNGWSFAWSGENRLIQASNALHLVSYAYDYQGRMCAKVVDGQTNGLVWDGFTIIAEMRPGATNWNVWGLDLSGTLQGAGGVGGLLSEVKDGVPYLAAFDANGNITDYVATNGTIAAHYEYSPFGEIVVQSGDMPDSFTHRFSTKPWCEVQGMSEYEFRMYSPWLGRWLSREPIGEEGFELTSNLNSSDNDARSKGNRYAFVDNAVLSLIDVFGLYIFGPHGNPVSWSGHPVGPSSPMIPTYPEPPPRCGDLNVTEGFNAKLNEIRSTFWSQAWADKRSSKCCELKNALSILNGGMVLDFINWDILALKRIGDGEYPPAGIDGSSYPVVGTRPEGVPEGLCERTVVISGTCQYGGAANYAMWGLMTKLCKEHTGDSVFSAWRAKFKADGWKLLKGGSRLIPAVNAFIDHGYSGTALPNATQSGCGSCQLPKYDKLDSLSRKPTWNWEGDGI